MSPDDHREQIRQAMADKGVTAFWLVRESKYSRVSDYLNGDVSPSIDNIYAMRKALNLE